MLLSRHALRQALRGQGDGCCLSALYHIMSLWARLAMVMWASFAKFRSARREQHLLSLTGVRQALHTRILTFVLLQNKNPAHYATAKLIIIYIIIIIIICIRTFSYFCQVLFFHWFHLKTPLLNLTWQQKNENLNKNISKCLGLRG